MKCIYKLGECPLPSSKETPNIITTDFLQYCTLCPLRINATQQKESEFTKELEKEFLKAIMEGIKRKKEKMEK